jgi:hypothetical protein
MLDLDTSRFAMSCPRFSCLLFSRISSLFILKPPFAKLTWHEHNISLPSILVNTVIAFYGKKPTQGMIPGLPTVLRK